MFVGHYGVALAAKRLAPRASLGTLILAAQLADLIWPLFLLAGIERVSLVPNANPFLRLAFDWYPWTHSLVAGLLWAGVVGIAYMLRRGDRRAAIVVGALVLSHWVLDYVSHVPDLPIYPGGPRFGLGLWRSFAATMIVEALIFGVGVVIYAMSTRAADRVGRFAFWGLIIFLAVIYFANAYSPPPPSVNAVAWASLAGWLFPVWGWWIARHRTPTHA